jgi:polyferredoxin
MEIFLVFLICLFVLELWAIWWQHFYEDSFNKALDNTSFWFRVFCGYVCFVSLGQKSVITETNHDGEIVREVFIGR